MGNSSTMWNKMADLLTELGMPDLSPYQAMLILAAAFLALLFILWLIFRRLRLWYWKTDIQIDTLKSIDFRLHNVEKILTEKPAVFVENTENETQAQDGPEPSTGIKEERMEHIITGLTAVGKSGRIYTEAELELLIRE